MKFPLFKTVIVSYLAFAASLACAREPITPIRGTQNHVTFGGSGELLDDVYSADLGLAVEYAPWGYFSLYGNFSYRLLSYEFDTMFHGQRHEAMNLDVNGFNETYLGVKLMPNSNFGVELNWRLPPGGGSQTKCFHRFGVEPFGVFAFSKKLLLGGGAGYFTFFEKDNFQPGDEFQLRGSLVWNFAWEDALQSGWELSHVFLYRWRIQESENLNLDSHYRKMDDLYQGFRMRTDLARYFSLSEKKKDSDALSLGVAVFYEMNRGYIFGFETGHTLGLYSTFKW